MLDAMEDRTLLSTIEVMNLKDSGAGSLRAAVISANADPGSLITFKPGVHGTITLTGGELSIAESVTIQGPGAGKLAISGNNASRVFEVASGQDVSIIGVTITRGYAADTGGGILNDGSSLTLSGVNLSRNVVTEGTTDGARGGGLYSTAGVVTISNSQIDRNEARGGAGASNAGNAAGGGIFMLGGTLTLGNDTLNANATYGGDDSTSGGSAGGAVHTAVPTTIIHSTFDGDIAQGAENAPDNDATGGALDVYVGSTTAIASSVFHDNHAIGGNVGNSGFVGEASGGAINNYGTMSVDHTTIDGNVAIGGSDGNSGTSTADPFIDYAFGGGIAATEAKTTLTSSTIDHNQAIGGNNSTAVGTDVTGVGGAEGGALYSEVQDTMSVSNCTITGNQAIGGNGNSANAPVALVGEGLGAGIVSGYGGPGANTAPNVLNVTDTKTSSNIAKGGNDNSGTASVSALVGVGAGGGIANYAGGSATIVGSGFYANQAISGGHNTAGGTGTVFANLAAGGGLFNYLGLYNSANYGVFGVTTADISTSTFTANDAQGTSLGIGEGGGLFNDASSSLSLTDVSTTQNQATGSAGTGGGVYTVGEYAVDSTSLISHNKAKTNGNNVAT